MSTTSKIFRRNQKLKDMANLLLLAIQNENHSIQTTLLNCLSQYYKDIEQKERVIFSNFLYKAHLNKPNIKFDETFLKEFPIENGKGDWLLCVFSSEVCFNNYKQNNDSFELERMKDLLETACSLPVNKNQIAQVFYYAAETYYKVYERTKLEKHLSDACYHISIASKTDQIYEDFYVQYHFIYFKFILDQQKEGYLESAKLILENLIQTRKRDHFLPFLIRLNYIQMIFNESEKERSFLNEIKNSPLIDLDSLSLIKIEQIIYSFKSRNYDPDVLYSVFQSLEFNQEHDKSSSLKGHILFLLLEQLSNHKIPTKFMREVLWSIWINWSDIITKEKEKCLILKKNENFYIQIFLEKKLIISLLDLKYVVFSLVDILKEDKKQTTQLINVLKVFLCTVNSKEAEIIRDIKISCYESLSFWRSSCLIFKIFVVVSSKMLESTVAKYTITILLYTYKKNNK